MADTDTPLELTKAEINEAARYINEKKANPTIRGVEVTPSTITESSYRALNDKLATLQSASAMKKPQGKDSSKEDDAGTTQFADAAADDLLPGGVSAPEGYEYVGTFNDHLVSTPFTLYDLGEEVQIKHIDGISAALDGKARGHEGTGVLTCRIIHDFAARGYVFRKDTQTGDGRASLTLIEISYGHGAPPLTA